MFNARVASVVIAFLSGIFALIVQMDLVEPPKGVKWISLLQGACALAQTLMPSLRRAWRNQPEDDATPLTIDPALLKSQVIEMPAPPTKEQP